MKGMGILLWCFAGIYAVILLCCCSRIRLGVAILEATSDFVSKNPSVFLVPIIFFFVVGAWICWWVISAIYVFSVGTPERTYGGVYANIVWDDTTRYVWIYHLFGLFWISAFIIGSAQFILASAVCIWYFSQGGDSDDKGKFAVARGTKWLFRYHAGSIAFGSFIIAVM